MDIALLLGVSLVSTFLGFVLIDKTKTLDYLGRFMITIGSGVNDLNNYSLDEEEQMKLSRQYSLMIIKELLILTLLLVLVVALAGAPFLLIDFAAYEVWELVIYICVGVTVASFVYMRFFFNTEKRDYSDSKKLFYYLTLGMPAFQKLAYWVQKIVTGKPNAPKQGIMVTGLARAGTTTLLNYLYQHPKLKSITYRHMPFLMGSKLWLRMNRGKTKKAERAHQDGILVDLDSPEAFDDYFWRIILKQKYYRGKGELLLHSITEEDIQLYEQYIAPTLEEKDDVYLSKNNNFILRMQSFLKKRDNYQVVMVFREPLDHAASLLRQQQLQSANQEEDPFVQDYMDWLGHNEFGQNRKDFVFNEEPFTHHDKETLDYWLERWISYYSYALRIEHPLVEFVSNYSIATQPLEVVRNVLSKVNLEFDYEYPTRSPKDKTYQGYSETLYKKAREIYTALREREAQKVE